MNLSIFEKRDFLEPTVRFAGTKLPIFIYASLSGGEESEITRQRGESLKETRLKERPVEFFSPR